MKTSGLRASRAGSVRTVPRRGTKDGRQALAEKRHAYEDPTICPDCHSVYKRRTWRRRRISLDLLERAAWRTCPACVQVRTQVAYGRLLLPASAARDGEVVRRLRNVAARAGFTQPERRLVGISTVGGLLEVRTTSQKLAHRMARELEKAFGGRAELHWSDRNEAMLAVWTPRPEATAP
jgi:hypothetical protein